MRDLALLMIGMGLGACAGMVLGIVMVLRSWLP